MLYPGLRHLKRQGRCSPFITALCRDTVPGSRLQVASLRRNGPRLAARRGTWVVFWCVFWLHDFNILQHTSNREPAGHLCTEIRRGRGGDVIDVVLAPWFFLLALKLTHPNFLVLIFWIVVLVVVSFGVANRIWTVPSGAGRIWWRSGNKTCEPLSTPQKSHLKVDKGAAVFIDKTQCNLVIVNVMYSTVT